MYERDLGDLGETVFRGLCNAVGLTVHKAEKDRTGWDFLLEFPWEQENDLPRDMLSAPIECKVQIKATDKKKKKTQVTVSNLSRLVKTQLPAFFCFIEFDGKDDPQAVYLVHVDEKIIEKTLKRIRELEAKGEEKLNKHKVDIRYTDEDRLPDITGKTLKDAIKNYVPNGWAKYAENKNKLLNTLGFEEGKGQFTVTFSSKNPIEDIVDLSLGIREEICIDKSDGYYSRFGILSSSELLSSEEARLSIKAKPTPVVLKFKEHQFSPGVLLNAELYTSPFNQFLTEQYLKLRIKSKLFEFVVEPFNGKVKCSFDFRDEHRISLDDLKNHLRVVTLLKKASHPLIVEVSDKAKKALPLPFRININDDIDDWSDVYQMAEMASSICQRFSVLENDVLVTIGELVQASQSIESFYQIVNADPKSVYIDFSTDFPQYQENEKLACTSSMMAVIGNHTIACFWAIIGSLSLTEASRFRLVAEQILVGSELIFVDNEAIEQDVVDERFDEFEQELEEMGLVILRQDH